MKYPFLLMFVSVLLATFVFVILGAAAFAEIKELLVRKAGFERSPAD